MLSEFEKGLLESLNRLAAAAERLGSVGGSKKGPKKKKPDVSTLGPPVAGFVTVKDAMTKNKDPYLVMTIGTTYGDEKFSAFDDYFDIDELRKLLKNAEESGRQVLVWYVTSKDSKWKNVVEVKLAPAAPGSPAAVKEKEKSETPF